MEELINKINDIKYLFEDSDSIFIFVKDKHGRYMYVNTAFMNFCGSGMTVLFERAEDVFHRSPKQMIAMQSRDADILSGKMRCFEGVVRLTGASEVPATILIQKTPLRHKNKILGIMGMGFDITTLKGASEILFKSYLKPLSPQEKSYFWQMSRKLDSEDPRKEISRAMGIEESHGDKIKSEITKKLDLRDEAGDAYQILAYYRRLFNTVAAENEEE